MSNIPAIRASFLNLRLFSEWAVKNGYSVGENRKLGNKRLSLSAHSPTGYHPHDLAVDVNKNGPSERRDLIRAQQVAAAFGLSTIYALYGTRGAAANHKTHLHVDVGPWSDLGAGAFRTIKSTSVATARIQQALHLTDVDNIKGPATQTAIEMFILASSYGGNGFPKGIPWLQRRLGVAQTGKWDAATRKAHDRATSRISAALGLGNGTTVTARLARELRK